MGKLTKLASLLRNEAGNALIIAAAGMPALIGAGGLATDTVQWTLWKRELQRSADSGALAGAYSLAQDNDVGDAIDRDLELSNNLALAATPTVETPPTAGSYSGRNNAVRVVLTTSRSLPFSSLFLSEPPVIRAESTAAVITNGQYCVVSLDDGTSAGITMQGNATVSLGCGMIANSRASNAVIAGGSSTITATPVAAVGGLQSSGNYVQPTTLIPYTVPQQDPYADLPTPNPTGCSGQVNVNPHQSRTISPGCYRGMNINGTLTLQPGVYYIDGNSLSFGSQAVVAGAGVTFILTSSNVVSNPSSVAKVDINGGAEISLTAPESGTYAGVLMYQDRRASSGDTNRINGNANSKLQGALYFPRQDLIFNGTAGMETDCIQIASRRVTFTGNSSVNNDCPPASGAHSFTGTVVRLVG